MPLPYPKSTLDANQCIQFAFSEETGRLRTDASFSGNISVNLDSAGDGVHIGDPDTGYTLEINSDGSINANVAVTHVGDSIRLGDGTNFLTSTTIGSDIGLDVNILNSIEVTGKVDALIVGINEYIYNEITIAAGATSTVVSQFFPTAYKLRRAKGSGENLGVFELKFNATGVDKYRTTYTDFNVLLDYETGISIPAGTTVTMAVTNSTNTPALYSTQLMFSAK